MQKIKIGFRKILKSSGSWKIKIIKLVDFTLGSLMTRVVKSKVKSSEISGTFKRLLVIRPGGIGDAIFILPFFKLIKSRNPDLQIDVLCEKRNAQIFRSQGSLCGNVYLYSNLISMTNVFKNIYDVVLATEQWHYLSALVAYFTKSPKCIGFATRPLRNKLYSQSVDYGVDSYEMTNFQRLFRFIVHDSAEAADINYCFGISDENLAWAEESIPKTSVTIFLGASIPERRLTKEQSIPVIRFIIDLGYYVVLLGGKDVLSISNEITSEINTSSLQNFVGKISIEKSAALIKKSQLFLGPDSGLMHLACAVGTPVIAIWGPGNLSKWGPRGPQHTVIDDYAQCATQFGYTVIPRYEEGYQSMAELTPERIISVVKEKLKN